MALSISRQRLYVALLFVVLTVITLIPFVVSSITVPPISFIHNPTDSQSFSYTNTEGYINHEYANQMRIEMPISDITNVVGSTIGFAGQSVKMILSLKFNLLNPNNDLWTDSSSSFDEITGFKNWNFFGDDRYYKVQGKPLFSPVIGTQGQIEGTVVITTFPGNCMFMGTCSDNSMNFNPILLFNINGFKIPLNSQAHLLLISVNVASIDVSFLQESGSVASFPTFTASQSPPTPLIPSPSRFAMTPPDCTINDSLLSCAVQLRALEGRFHSNDKFTITLGSKIADFTPQFASVVNYSYLKPSGQFSLASSSKNPASAPENPIPGTQLFTTATFLVQNSYHSTTSVRFTGMNFVTPSVFVMNDYKNNQYTDTLYIMVEYFAAVSAPSTKSIQGMTYTISSITPSSSTSAINDVVSDQQWRRYLTDVTFRTDILAGEGIFYSFFDPTRVPQHLLLIEKCAFNSQTVFPSISGPSTVFWSPTTPLIDTDITVVCTMLIQDLWTAEINIPKVIATKYQLLSNGQHRYTNLVTVDIPVISGPSMVSYRPAAIRATSVVHLSPNNRNVYNITIPDLCAWTRGDKFILQPSPSSEQSLLNGITSLISSRSIWDCGVFGTTPAAIECTLNLSAPCPWLSLVDTTTTHPNLVRGFQPLDFLTTTLSFHFSTAFPTSTMPSQALTFSTQLHFQTSSTQRDLIHLPSSQLNYNICSHIPTTIFPAHIQWAAIFNNTDNTNIGSYNSLKVYPLQSCKSLYRSYSDTTSFNSNPFPVISPVITVTDTNYGSLYGLHPLSGSFRVTMQQRVNGFPSLYNLRELTQSVTDPVPGLYQYGLTSQNDDQTLFAVDPSKTPSFTITFTGDGDGTICPNTPTAGSCLITSPTVPRDQYSTLQADASHGAGNAEISLARAALSVGTPSSQDPLLVFSDLKKALNRDIVSNRIDSLDHLTFDFGNIPAFLDKKLMPVSDGKRDQVYIIIRALGATPNARVKIEPNPPIATLAAQKTKVNVNGDQNGDEIDNLQCIWDGSYKVVFAATPDSSIRLPIHLSRATSPRVAYINTYKYGPRPLTQWQPVGDVIGVYNLPNLDEILIGSQLTMDISRKMIPNLRLNCFTLFDITSGYNKNAQYSVEIQGPSDVISVPFAQKFYNPDDSSQTGDRIKIDTGLNHLLEPRQKTYQVIASITTTPPDPSPTVSMSFTVAVELPVRFTTGDIFKIDLKEVPVWLDYDNINIYCPTVAFTSSLIKVSTQSEAVSLSYEVVYSGNDVSEALLYGCGVTMPRRATFKPTTTRHLQPYEPTIELTFFDNRYKFNSMFSSSATKLAGFLRPFVFQSIVCPPNRFGPTCSDFIVEIPPSTTPLTQLPPPVATLPSTTADPTSRCHVVVDVNGLYQRFNSSYTRMCSIPTAGTLTVSSVPIESPDIPTSISSYYSQLDPTLTRLNVCDCNCNGYWWDEPTTFDFKKCTRCIVPDGCPNMMTPNADCTTCECTTPLCRKLATYTFSTLYITPKLLKMVVNNLSDPTSVEITKDITTDELQSYLYHPSSENKIKYRTMMSSFSKFLLNYYLTELNAVEYSSKLESITISPLIEGSFTTWKLTFGIINTAGLPMVQMSPLYGLAPFTTKDISQLFVQWCFDTTYNGLFQSTGLDSTSSLGLLLQQQVSVPIVVSDDNNNNSQSTKLSLFITDNVITKCLKFQDYIKSINDSTFIITPDILHTCPTPNQYIPIGNLIDGNIMNQTMLNRYQQLNQLWSPCSGWDLSSTTLSSAIPSSSTITSYINYENFLDNITTLPQTILSTRQIYPQCFDFTGTNIGLKHYVKCKTPDDYIIFSTQRDILLNPTYLRNLLSSFNINDIPATNTITLERLKQYRLVSLPKFPNFPQSTTVLCSKPQRSSSPSDPSNPGNDNTTQRCPTGKYGQSCQFDIILDQHSLSASPTVLTIDAHSHISWSYQGDDRLEMTLIMKSTQKEKDGKGQYPFSQILGTVPLSYLYSTPQLPTFTNSILFRTIYDMIHINENDLSNSINDNGDNNNEDFINVYGANGSTNIIIEGYLTQDATKLISLNAIDQPIALHFTLPMVCNELDVTCSDEKTQYCYQGDGRCKCRSGYYDSTLSSYSSSSNNDHTIEHPYQLGTNGGVIDGSQLQCIPICQNDGEWDKANKKCKCKPNTLGEYCQELSKCDSTICNSNGFIPLNEQGECSTSTTNNNNNQECKCNDGWKNIDVNSPLSGSSLTTTTSQCTFCPLYPYHNDYYTSGELDNIKKWYDDVPGHDQYGTFAIDGMYNQTYIVTSTTTPTTPFDPQKEQKQRCYITGTDHNILKSQCPTNNKCPCRRGYGGDYCQLHIAYAKFPYTKMKGIEYNYDPVSQKIFYAKFIEEVSLSMLNYPSSQIFIDEHNRDKLYVIVGFYTGVDFFKRNEELLLNVDVDENNMFNILATTTKSTTGGITTPPTSFDPTLPPNLDSLYTQWGDLQQQFPTAPIKNQDSNNYLGEIGQPEPIQDSTCFEQNILGCSGEVPKRASSKALLIGLVVGLVSAALLFIILVLILLWCKKNQRGFWKSEKEQRKDEMSSFVFTKSKKFDGSTKAPEMTIGTSSITPLSGLEMSATAPTQTTTSVQSVNNHTEIKDPTLPSNTKAYKDTKGQIFYVNSETMTTSWTHPNEVGKAKDNEGGDDGYGAGW